MLANNFRAQNRAQSLTNFYMPLQVGSAQISTAQVGKKAIMQL